MIKKIFSFSMATWLGAVISFVLLPIASHLYPSYDLGVINYYYSIINIIFTFILFGYDQSFLRFYSEYTNNEKKIQFTKHIVLTIILIIVFGLLCTPFSSRISLWLLDYNSKAILPIMISHLIGLTVTRYFIILFRLKSILIEYTFFSIVNTILLKSMYLLGYPIDDTAFTGIAVTAFASIIIVFILFCIRKNDFEFSGIFSFGNRDIEEWKYALLNMPHQNEQ